MRSLADIVAFNAANADRALRFGQDIFLAAEATRGDLSELEYVSARQMDLRASRDTRARRLYGRYRLDAVLFPGVAGAAIAAKAGYPSVQVPAGFVAGVRDKDTPDYPYGATFTGRAWSEPVLLASCLRLRAGDPGAPGTLRVPGARPRLCAIGPAFPSREINEI